MRKGTAFHAGVACWEHRDAIAAASAQLRHFAAAIPAGDDLPLHEWSPLFAAALDFGPTLIIELGRQGGASTCVLTTAAKALDARVVSVCPTHLWRMETMPRIARLVPPSWLSHLEARAEDAAAADFEAIVGDATRVLLFWRTPGVEVAEHALGRLLPVIADRPHLVIAHGIGDARHRGPVRSVEARYPMWGSGDRSGRRVRIGHFDSGVEQAVAIVDFASRNGLTLRTAAEDVHHAIGAHAFRVEAMERTLGDLWPPQAEWCHFSLNERPGPYRFPAAARAVP